MFWASPEVALQKLCTDGDLVKPPQLRFRAYSSAACQVMLREGWIAVKLVIMTGIWPRPETAPKMLYEISLYTTKERLNRDLDRMRSVIASFRIFQPQ